MGNWKRYIVITRTFTTTGQASTLFVGDFKEFILWVHVTAVTGTTPTLNLRRDLSDDLEASPSWVYSAATGAGGSDEWNNATGGTLTSITAAGAYWKKFNSWFGGHVRLYATVGGTNPVFTVTITVEGIED